MFDPLDIKKNRKIAAVGYIGILCFLPLLLKPKSAFAQFHGKQATVLFIAEVIVMLGNFLPIIGQIISFVSFFVFLYLIVKGFSEAWKGNKWEMPYLGKYANKIDL